jgi:hypothetical protein
VVVISQPALGRVVGLVKDTKYNSIRRPAEPMIWDFLPARR